MKLLYASLGLLFGDAMALPEFTIEIDEQTGWLTASWDGKSSSAVEKSRRPNQAIQPIAGRFSILNPQMISKRQLLEDYRQAHKLCDVLTRGGFLTVRDFGVSDCSPVDPSISDDQSMK